MVCSYVLDEDWCNYMGCGNCQCCFSGLYFCFSSTLFLLLYNCFIIIWSVMPRLVDCNASSKFIVQYIHCVEVNSFMPTFRGFISWIICWILPNAFSASTELFLYLSPDLLLCEVTLITCILGLNPTWSWCMTLLVCCWI